MLIRSIARNVRNFGLVIPGWVEKLMLRGEEPPGGKIKLPLVAIIGPPRVGSTLMYQLLVSQYRFFHFDNFQHTFLRYPYLAFRISKQWIPKPPIDFRSDHGFVGGVGGLSEGNFFWPFWLDMPIAQKEARPRADRLRHVRHVFNRIYADVQEPMVTSYNAHAFYLAELPRYFKKLAIVNMRRDPVANAISLLRGRKKLRSNVEEWWSIRPAACLSLLDSADSYSQIACQVVETYRQVQQQRILIPDVPIVDVHYEKLCAAPTETLAQIADACESASIDLFPRPDALPIPDLSVSSPRPGEQEDTDRFRSLFEGVDWDELWS